MHFDSILSRAWKTTAKTVVGIFSLFVIVLISPSLVEAFKTASVRTSDGSVHQIRFLSNDPSSIYQVGEFIDDFSVYNQTGDVELCPGPDDPVAWELYAAARVLAKTRRSTPVYDTAALVEALGQAVVDQELAPKTVGEKLVVGEIVGHITSEIQSHTFLESLRIIPRSGPVAVIALPANLIAKMGKTEVRMRKLLYAFWIASTHANTAIALQEVANQEAAKLWDAINAGTIIDFVGGELDVDIAARQVSGDMSIDGPLRLRLMAEVYQENAERAAELGADLGSDNAWFSWLLGLTGIGGILELIVSPIDVHRLKGALEELETSSGERLADKIEENIEDIYDSAEFQLDWHHFCSPDLRFGASYFDVYEGHDLIYTVALDSPPNGVATITISSDNPDATVSPTVLTFTANDWYKPKTVRMRTVEDADIVNERVSLTHTATGYGDILPHAISFLIIDRKGNEAPELVKTIDSLSLSLGDELRLNIAAYFRDPEGGELRYSHSVVGQNFDVLSVQRDAVGSWITIRPQKIGSTRMHIWARDPEGLETGLAFPVTVTDPRNRPPMTADTIPDQTLTVGDSSAPLDLPTYFHDPDSDTLTYTVVSSDPNVATSQRVGSQLTIWSWAVGTTTITVTATDPDDLSTEQTFTATVTAAPTQTQPPEPVGKIPDQTLTEGGASKTVDVSAYFSDPEGDILTYTAWTDIPNVVKLLRENSLLTITSEIVGTAAVIVRATDPDGLYAIQRFTVRVTVPDAPPPNRAPQVLLQIPAHALTVGNSAALLPVSSYFNDPDGNALTYTSSTSNTSVATVSLSGSPVLITPVAAGTATITVTASDGELQATQSFVVTIAGSSQQNQAPEVINSFNPQNFRVGDEPKRRNLSSYFSDPDDNTLTYTATSSNSRIAAASISGNSVKITPGEPGTATITVTASDGELQATQSFRVNVQTKLQTIPSLPVCDRTPQVREEIMKRTRDNNCANVTEDELESIRRLSLIDEGLVTLKQGDFDELRNLEELILNENLLRTLPEDVFWYLGELEELSLRDNQIATLIKDTFEHLDSLTYLTLQGNQLTTLQQGAFDDLEMLIELDLSENQLTTLPVGVFRDLSNLEELDLENNNIAILSRDSFSGLSSLEDLYLEGNPLQTIKAGAFNGLNNLTKLDFDSDLLRIIEAGAFNGLNSLTELDLSYAQLTTLQQGVFSGLSSLEDLYLDDNPLQTIEAGAFNGLNNLTYLNLDDTQLQTIEAGAFSGLDSLTRLNLNSAQLRTLQRGVFSGLSSLKRLDLDDNPLQTIEAGAFSGLDSLTYLDLYNTQLRTLQRDVFSDLSSLENLDLDEGVLHTIEVGAFNGLSNLISLDLDENQLAMLPVGIFKGLSRLERLDLRNNPGAPFTMTLELARTDNTNVEAAEPATVKVTLAEGAPFDMNIRLSIKGGTLSADIATLTTGQTESNPITVTQTSTSLATVRLGIAPTIPQGYRGIQMAVGTPLVLFSEQLNRPPVAVGTIPAQTLAVSDAAIVVNVSDKFNDADRDTLHYTASSDNTGVVSVSMSGTQVTLVPEGAGDATVTVTASDSELTTTQTISVSVIADLPEETWMPDANLRVAVRDALGLVPNDTLTQQAMLGLINLRYRGSELSDNEKIVDLTGLEYALNLDHLNLYAHLISDILPLERLTKLRSLWLAGNKIVSIRPLTGLPLEELGLGGNPIADFGPLAELTSLTRLDFWGNGLGNSDLHFITGLTQLTHLNLRNNQISDITLVTKLVNLEALQLKGNPISDTSPLRELLRRNPNLEIDIEISEEPPVKPDPTDPSDLSSEVMIPDANLRAAVREVLGLTPNEVLTQQAMLGLTSLRYLGLELSDNEKIVDLTGLEYALNLDHLNLYGHLISDLRSLARLTKLRSLWLAGNKIANVHPLTSLPLEELGLGGNPITDFTPLAELTNLTRLDFWGNGLGNNHLQSITGLTQLMQLDLRNNQISDVTLLTKLVNLKKLQLKGNPISDTSPLRELLSGNPNLEIDIEINPEPPSEPDPEIETEGPDLVIESLRANNTTVTAGGQFRLDVVIRNQGKAVSGAATIRFYRSSDETISTVDTQVTRASLPAVAANATGNKWVRLTAPNTAGVYYYGVCVDRVADESDTENNCSTAVKITVGTPAVDEPPVDATSLAKKVFNKHSGILRRPDVKEVLPNVLTALKDPDIQPLLIPATINLVIADPDLLKKTVPTIRDEFIRLLKQDAEIKTLLNDAQVQTLLQTPAAIDELARLLGISVAPPPAASAHWIPDANLRAAVRKTLGLKLSDPLTQQSMQGLTRLDVALPRDAAVENKIKDITGLEHATQLTWLQLWGHEIRDITPLKNLTALTWLYLGSDQIRDITPLKNLTALTWLGLGGNQIRDITPLKNLTALTDLSLEVNQIRDITPLKNLRSLTTLFLYRNQIKDITPIENLTALTWLELSGNPIADLAPLRRLKAKNPNMQIDIDLNARAAPAAPVSPDETALFPNYPNPFNPETWIPYQLATAADVTLTIHDVRGVVVRRLALGHKPAGFYQSQARAAHWDGRNELGEKVASGLYFYTFTADDFTATGKMLIRK